MGFSGPHFPLHDQEAAWKTLISYGMEAQARHIEQNIGHISQVIGELNKPGIDRAICVQVMREFARIVIQDLKGLVAFSHLAETMIPPQPRLSSPAPAGEEIAPMAPVADAPRAGRPPAAHPPEADPLQTWRDASDSEFLNRLKAWMEEADVSQDELCRVLEYKPVYVTRVMRGTDPLTSRFRERLLDYVASRGNGRAE